MSYLHWLRRLAPFLLIAILAIAAGLRLYNINWDSGMFAHPDERSTVAFFAPTITWPENSADLLDPRASPLNPFWNVDAQEPRSYTYGHFPLYVLALTAYLLNELTPVAQALGLPGEWIQFLSTAQTGEGYAHIGRALVALADVFTVYLIFLMGRRMYGLWTGLLAAALSAFTVLQIQLAHFFAVDPITTTFTMLTLYGSMLLYERKSVGAAVVAGIGVALAVASKFSALPIVIVPVVAGLLAVSRQRKETKESSPQPSPSLQSRMIGLVVLALALSFVIFAVTSPFVLLDFQHFKRFVLDDQGNMVSGVADFPFTRQYRGTTAYWYFIEQQLRWGMGWPLGLLGLAGTVWVIVKAIRGQAQVGELLCLTWIVVYFGPTGLFLAKFMRYMVPIVPLFTLFGAGMVAALWRWRTYLRRQTTDDEGEPTGERTSASLQQGAKVAAMSIAVVVLAGTAFWAAAFVNGVYGTEHSWITFSRWMYNNIPDGSCIAYEHWDDQLPKHIPEPDGYPAAHNFFQPQLPMYDDDSQQKYELIRSTLMDCDYIALASNRLWRSIPRLPERYPMSSRYYEALFSGELGFEQVYTVQTPPRLGPFVIDSQPADESFTVYDHPQPILFQKTRQLSEGEWDAVLGDTWQEAIPGYTGEPTLLMRLRGAQQSFGQPAIQAATEAEKKSLMLDRPVDELTPIDDYRWNDIANASPLAATVLWWFAVTVIGLLVLPLTVLLFHKLPNRGYALSKSFGLLAVSYLVWISSSLVGARWLGNTLLTTLAALIILALINALIFIRHYRIIAAFLYRQRWLILVTEALFGLVYLLFVYLRVLNPDLWHPWLGGEKMLEIGFLNAVVKSVEMPPYDPFFAGGIINYYYYGLFLVGVLIKLTGIQPAIAFNLAVPTLAALTAVNAFSLAGSLAASTGVRSGSSLQASMLKAVPAGILAVLFIVFMGNIEGAAQFIRDLANVSIRDFETAIPGINTLLLAAAGLIQVLGGNGLAVYNYWDPTRVIPETINEFPFFSFLFADLHPHMIGLPFTLLFLSLAYNWLLPAITVDAERINNEPQSPAGERSFFISNSQFLILNSQFSIPSLLRWLALPFVLGAIAAINTWDLPTYLGLMVATFLLSRYRKLDAPFTLRRAAFLLVSAGFFAIALLATTYLLYLPFFTNYQPPAETGLGLVHTQTSLLQHLKIWGFFGFVISSWLWLSLLYPQTRNSFLRAASLFLRRWNVWPHLYEIYRRLVTRKTDAYHWAIWGVGLLGVIVVLLILLGYYVPAYLLPLVVLALVLLFRREVSATTAYLSLLAFTGLLILLGIEFFFLRDFLGGGPYYRMNTLFKFFIQVWVIFGIVAALVMPQIWNRSMRWAVSKAIIWRALVMLLLIAGFVYPILGTRTRIDDRFPGPENRPPIGTLDGLAYMRVGTFEWPAGNPIELKYDYEAIRWLQENIEGTPILAEAKIGYYREGGMRVAAYTGLPSILGGLHQNEQRYPSQVGERDFVVNELWTTFDPDRALELINQLNVEYIYVGQIERATYGEFVGDKFEQLYDQGQLDLVFENEETKIYRNVSGGSRSDEN